MSARSLGGRRPVWLAALITATLLVACGDQTLQLPFVPTPKPTPEHPRAITVRVTDLAATPLPGAQVVHDRSMVLTGLDGTASVSALTRDAVEAHLTGHDSAESEVPADADEVVIELRPNVARGTVTDPGGVPVAAARVFVDGEDRAVTTDEAGQYELAGVPEGATLIVKRAGYRLAEVATASSLDLDVVLEPFEVRALYAPAAVFETAGRLDELLALLDRTEANALVIDVKETDGRLYYATDLPEAQAVRAVRETPIFDPAELLPMLRERGIYTIARMVAMKDNTLTAARPELAVRNTASGEPWRDNIGGAWLDPSAPGVAEYVTAVATDLADRGFDEVQLDYIRWYSDGPTSLAETNLPNTQSVRLPAIGRVLRLVSEAFETRRAFIGADVFPISFILPDDQGIGQRPEVIMPFVDYFSPMVYPSHYGPGVFGHAIPNEAPYDVIDKTLEIMTRQAEGMPLAIRPWIQDFGYGTFRAYGPDDVRAEMQALADNATNGWMIWNPSAVFTEAALGPPRDGEAAGPVLIDGDDLAAPTSAPSGGSASASPATAP